MRIIYSYRIIRDMGDICFLSLLYHHQHLNFSRNEWTGIMLRVGRIYQKNEDSFRPFHQWSLEKASSVLSFFPRKDQERSLYHQRALTFYYTVLNWVLVSSLFSKLSLSLCRFLTLSVIASANRRPVSNDHHQNLKPHRLHKIPVNLWSTSLAAAVAVGGKLQTPPIFPPVLFG